MNSLLVKAIDKVFPPKIVYAHCDIPCGIYDPHAAQLAAHTVIRMTNMINDLNDSSEKQSFEERKKIISQISRLTGVKEEHAELVKHEIRILWGDYFKPVFVKEYPNLHENVHEVMMLASNAKQAVDKKAANDLLEAVQKIAEIFWRTKGRETVRIKSTYPSEKEIVIPKEPE